MKLVAIGGMVLNFFWVPYMALTSPFTYYDFGLVALCLYALILVAMRKENPRLLIPFLIFNVKIFLEKTRKIYKFAKKNLNTRQLGPIHSLIRDERYFDIATHNKFLTLIIKAVRIFNPIKTTQ